MKQKFTITLLDTPMSIVSDDSEERVRALADRLNERVRGIVLKSRKITKAEAALFCALEYLGELEECNAALEKAQAQSTLYANNIVRLKEENDRLSKKVDMLEARLKK